MHSSSLSPVKVIRNKDNEATELYISAKQINMDENEGAVYDYLFSCIKGARNELMSEVMRCSILSY